MLARSVADLRQSLPVLRRLSKQRNLPCRPEPTSQAQRAREQLWGDLVAPEGRGEERKVYLDIGWDRIRESSAGRTRLCLVIRKSRGAGKV